MTNFGWLNIVGTNLALFDFTFDVTGGTLAAFYVLGLGCDIALSEISSFTGNWQEDHEGIKVKHDTAPMVPIPATVWLLGTALVGLIGFGKRFRKM